MENVHTTAEMEVKIQDVPLVKSWGKVDWRNYPMKRQHFMEQGQ